MAFSVLFGSVFTTYFWFFPSFWICCKSLVVRNNCITKSKFPFPEKKPFCSLNCFHFSLLYFFALGSRTLCRSSVWSLSRGFCLFYLVTFCQKLFSPLFVSCTILCLYFVSIVGVSNVDTVGSAGIFFWVNNLSPVSIIFFQCCSSFLFDFCFAHKEVSAAMVNVVFWGGFSRKVFEKRIKLIPFSFSPNFVIVMSCNAVDLSEQ